MTPETLRICISPFLRHLMNQWPWISLRSHSRSYILAAIESPCTTLYRPLIVTFALSSIVSEILPVFTVRRSALHGLSYRNSVRLSVRPSVCHTRGLCPHGSTYDHDFFTIWLPHHSSFWGYHVHPKIRRGSPWARALNEGGVGTNWRFSTNKSPYLGNGAIYDKSYY